MIKPRPEPEIDVDGICGAHVDWLMDLFRLLRDEHLNMHHVRRIARIALGEEEIPEEWLDK